MKKTFKYTILVAILLLCLAGNSVPAMAASYGSHNLSTSWTTVAQSSTGFNCNVKLTCTAFDVLRVDVRMLGKNGNVVWQEANSCPGLSSRVYGCGSDVYKIQARVSSGKGICISRQTSEQPD